MAQKTCLKAPLSSKELEESVFKDESFATCQRHQVLCLQKRAQALVSVASLSEITKSKEP